MVVQTTCSRLKLLGEFAAHLGSTMLDGLVSAITHRGYPIYTKKMVVQISILYIQLHY